ncbi:MAG: response regulator [Endomicrobiales bacterium]|nr:response regulator [Endomicrobiales bacterium]
MTEKFLVIDDDPGFCTMLTRVLSDEGYRVDKALGGEEAIEKIRNEFFDILILDIKMPKIDGIEVMKRLREIQRGKEESDVIIITGFISETTPIEALRLGAVDYIMKPFEIKDFLHSIERNVKIIRLKRERNIYIGELSETNEKLKQTINELKNTRDKLIYSERLAAIGKVASGVGHDLRNLLGIIENASFLLKSSFKTKNTKINKYFSILYKALQESKKTLDDLLHFSKERKIEKAKISLKSLLQEGLDIVPLKSNIKTKMKIPSTIGSIYVDPLRMKQVLRNIISNAAQSMPKGGKISINTKSKNNHVKIEINDTGSGIDKKHLKNIFEPFFTTKTKGIGLGLAVAKEIIEKHNGKIEVKSKINKGSTFIIHLPTQGN